MDPKIEDLLREAERLIVEVESGGFESWCARMGFDPQEVRHHFIDGAGAGSEQRARELFADDMADINREVEARAAELRIVREREAPNAAAIRQRRRVGMV